MASNPVDDADLTVTKTDFKVPEKRTIEEIASMDAEDESLQKYKEALLGSAATAVKPPFPENPANFIAEQILFHVNGAVVATIKVGNLDGNTLIKISEGSKYRVELQYYVQRDILCGLKFIQATYKGPLRVAKEEVMLGSYAPKQEVQVWKSPEEEAPSGMLARGTYKIKSKFTDDDGHDYLTFEWKIEITK